MSLGSRAENIYNDNISLHVQDKNNEEWKKLTWHTTS